MNYLDAKSAQGLSIYLNHSGKLYPAGPEAINPAASLPGQGFFETIKVLDGRICLWDFHWDRASRAFEAYHWEPEAGAGARGLSDQILDLTAANGQSAAARVRLRFYEESPAGGSKKKISYSIESWPLGPSLAADPPDGLRIDIFSNGIRMPGPLAAFKMIGDPLYPACSEWCLRTGFDECLLLNPAGRVCCASIANVFAVVGNQVLTPPPDEGGVAGVMRRFILENAADLGYEAVEKAMEVEWLKEAEEIFLSNAIRGIRPVRHFRGRDYPIEKSSRLKGALDDFFSRPKLLPEKPV